MKKRFLAAFLAVIMCLSITTVGASATVADVNSGTLLAETTAKVIMTSPIRATTMSSNEGTIYNFLRNTLGCNEATACGILANIYAESGFNPTAERIDTNGLTSYGLCQWNGSRFESLKSYCGSSYNTVAGQLSYLRYELQSSEAYAWSCMQGIENSASGAYIAGYRWAQYFERCNSVYFESRAINARDTYWPKYGTGITSNTTPIGCVDSIVSTTPGTITVSGWAYDPDSTSTSIKVHVYVGGVVGSSNAVGYEITADAYRPDVNNVYGCGDYHGFYATISVSKTGAQPVYFYAIDTEAEPNPLIGSGNVEILKDSTAPVISDVQISDITSDGYTVSCTVTDDYGVDRVLFPTWTVANDQDDLDQGWTTNDTYKGTQDGNKYTFRVNVSDHNNESGTYITHIYAYDVSGNCSSVQDNNICAAVVPEKSCAHKWDNGPIADSVITDGVNGNGITDLRTYTCTICGKTKTVSINTTEAKDSALIYYPRGGTMVINDIEVPIEKFPGYGGNGSEDGTCCRWWIPDASNRVSATKEGYYFDGWYTSPDGGTEVTDFSSVALESGNVYAHWIKIGATSGKCGKTDADIVYWSFKDGTLTISGNGDIAEYNTEETGTGVATSYRHAPWFELKNQIHTIVIENGVTSIGQYTFDGIDVEEITIPTSVSSIAWYQSNAVIHGTSGSYAEQYAEEHGFTFVADLDESQCGANAHWKLDKNGVLTIYGTGAMYDYGTNAVTGFPETPWSNCKDDIVAVVVEDGITHIGDYAFEECDYLTSVELADSVTSIGTEAFFGDWSIENITLPSALVSIGDAAFMSCECEGVAKLELPESLQEIGDYAFAKTWIRNITIPDSVKELGEGVFVECYFLISVTLPKGLTKIGDEMFMGADCLTNLTIPESVTSIGTNAFCYCESLTDIYYAGTKEEWNAINVNIEDGNDGLLNATIHYNNNTEPSNEPTIPEQTTSFTDIKSTAYYANAVGWALANNITSGTSATTFSPDNTCTREQVVTFLWRANGCPEPTSTGNPFTDVDESSYAYKAILWAVEQGITTGTGADTFSPKDGCTRGQVVTFLWRAAGEPEVSGSSGFSDVSESAYYAKAVAWAVENGITSGTSATTFSPDDTCTRAQIVTFLYRDLA